MERQRECVERSERVFCAQLFEAFSLVVGYVYWEGRSVFVLGNGTGCVVDREFALKSGSCCVF